MKRANGIDRITQINEFLDLSTGGRKITIKQEKLRRVVFDAVGKNYTCSNKWKISHQISVENNRIICTACKKKKKKKEADGRLPVIGEDQKRTVCEGIGIRNGYRTLLVTARLFNGDGIDTSYIVTTRFGSVPYNDKVCLLYISF